MKFKVNKEDFAIIVKNSLSIADICRALNIRPIGGNYKTIKNKINIWNIDTTHFTGKGWNVGLKYKPFQKSIPIENILVENSTYTNTNLLKLRLFKEGLKEKKCENCGLSYWLNSEISLELHHKNGNNLDHRIENIVILCPNCHSQTPHYRGNNNKSNKNKLRKNEFEEFNDLKLDSGLIEVNKTIKKQKKIYYCVCGAQINKKSNSCLNCRSLNNRKTQRPELDILTNDIKELGYAGTGRKYGVSDNTIRKWIK